MAQQNITLPVGRFVQGSTTQANDKDMQGNPKVIRDGPNKGQPTQSFFIAVAIPKGQERGWWETPWGQQIYAVGQAAFPNQCNHPSFSWKIEDGDSPIKNLKGKAPNENEHKRGHWVVKCSSTFPPKCFNKDAALAIPPESVKTGFYIQVNLDVSGNGQQTKPGVYLNPRMLALSWFGQEIYQGPDPSQVGFGQNIGRPAGAMDMPPAGMPVGPGSPPVAAQPGFPSAPMPGPAYPQPGPGMQPQPGYGVPGPANPPGQPGYPGAAPLAPAAPAASAMPVGAPYAPPPAGIAPPASPSSVPPNPAFLGGPAAASGYAPSPAAPMAPPMPGQPAATSAYPSNVPQMTAKAAGASYQDFIARGWTDQMLREHGMMV